nr:MFS transporter [Methylomarinum sp. Ch1-1]MDP4522140.1 MFS transporter [Methylomarinum sp. Ch1-1]
MVFSTLSAWLRDEGIALSVIGYFSWVGVTYSTKVFWAPVIDRMALPGLTRLLGKRRGWMLIAQLGIALGLVGMGSSDVHQQLQQIALLAVAVAFCSSIQDIVVDAYRIEAAVPEYQGAMAAAYVFGYRVALLVAGAGAFYIADFSDWRTAYYAMASAMSVGIVATLLVAEPEHRSDQQAEAIEGSVESALGVDRKIGGPMKLIAWFSDAVVSPFVEFFVRNGKTGLLILCLIATYRLSDITMGVMANPFYLDLGFSKKEIAEISKLFGFVMTILGASLGGVLVVRFGIMRPLLLGAVMVASTNLLFALLAVSEPSLMLLAGVISADNLSGGIASAVFIAYLSSMTNSTYTATQYALFSSLMTLPAKLLGGLSGRVVEQYGYESFFIYAAVVGLPAIILAATLLALQRVARTDSHNR